MIRTPLSLPGRTVIFDYGEVISLSQSPADRAVIASLAGVGDGAAGERFWTAYHAHRDGLDQGSAGVAAYWRAIADDIGARWDDARLHELWAADFRSWLSVNPAIIDVLADLRAGGTPLALLSNAGPDYGSYFRHGPLADFFSACYVSGELGLLKPHPEIYRHVLGDLRITPADAVFIDNRDSNVAGAEALGITGHVFTDAGRLRAFLASLGPERPGARLLSGNGRPRWRGTERWAGGAGRCGAARGAGRGGAWDGAGRRGIRRGIARRASCCYQQAGGQGGAGRLKSLETLHPAETSHA